MQARQACLTAPPSITGTNQTLAGLFLGRIAYPVFDANGARILAASAGDHKTVHGRCGDQPEWQRNGGKFAYRVSGSGANVIENGNDVAVAPAGAEFPTFSPDGSRVIYSLQGNLYMINADGNGSPIDLGAGSAPTWGPGGLLAYSGCDGGGCGIMIRNPDNADPPKRLTGSPNDIPTSWSPDGFNISYYSNVSGNYDLFFVNTAGGVQQVTKATRATTWAARGGPMARTSPSSPIAMARGVCTSPSTTAPKPPRSPLPRKATGSGSACRGCRDYASQAHAG